MSNNDRSNDVGVGVISMFLLVRLLHRWKIFLYSLVHRVMSCCGKGECMSDNDKSNEVGVGLISMIY